MEFDDMKKIWDTQNNEPLYVLNEPALLNRIEVKKQKARHITNVSELLAIITNIFAGGFILGTTLYTGSTNPYLYIMAAWMFITATWCIVGRIKRTRSNAKFDRTILGDLDQVITTATYQVRLSQLLRWNIVPIGAFVALGLFNGDKSMWIIVGLLTFFAITWYASGFEHNYYKSRLGELQQLRKLLLIGDDR